MSIASNSAATTERERILEEYAKRGREVSPDLYSPWNSAELLAISNRRRAAVELLGKAGFKVGNLGSCLEVGYGTRGWLPELIGWGVPASQIHGMELDAKRAAVAQRLLPGADLRVGDATELPWASNTFNLVIVSTVFTSVLDNEVRSMLAGEIVRVLAQGGALLWYDFSTNNPKNQNVRSVTKKELKQLFPILVGPIKSVTLAPPLARLVAPKSWLLATLLESLPVFRTHLLAVLIKK